MLLLPTYQSLTEHLTKHVVVRLLLEFQGLDGLKVTIEDQTILAKWFEEVVDLCHFLKPTNLRILLCLVVDLHSLPRQFAYQKIQLSLPNVKIFLELML